MSRKKINKRKEATQGSTFINKKNVLFILLLLVVTFIVFSPSLQNQFTNWDDDLYVTNNTLITSISLNDLGKFGNTVVGNFHPLTMISLAIDYHFFKLDPFYYHLKNLLFHLLNTILVFFLVKRFSKQNLFIPFFTALIFGIHPMHVESVTWIAERKDVLYTFYFLIGLLSYYKYITEKKIAYFLIATASFILSGLAKSAAVVFPLVLFLIDFFENRKFTLKLLSEKIPLLAISAWIGLMAVNTQTQSEAVLDIEYYSLFEKIRFASFGFMAYLIKFIAPFDLCCYHQFPSLKEIPYIYNVSIPFALFIGVFSIIKIKKYPWLFFGMLFYLLTIILVLQFWRIGNAIIAERYTYVPYIGIGFIYLVFLEKGIKKYPRFKNVIISIFIIQLVFFSASTYSQTKVWESPVTLWAKVMKVYPKQTASYVNRGHYYRTINEYDKAIADYNKAIEIAPGHKAAHANRAKIYFDTGRYQLALADYNKSLEKDKDNIDSWSGRGATYAALGDNLKALADLTEAIKVDPKHSSSHSNRAIVNMNLKNYEAAIDDFESFLKLKPNDPDVISTIGYCYMLLKKHSLSLKYINLAIQLNSHKGAYYLTRSYTYNAMNNKPLAKKDALLAQKLGAKVSSNYLMQLDK